MRQKNDGTHRASLLRQLAGHPGGAYTTDLLTDEFLAAHHGQRDPRQRALTHLGGALRDLESAGLVKRTGMGRGGWQQGPTTHWVLTEKGFGLLAYWSTNPEPYTTRHVRLRNERAKRRIKARDAIEEAAKEYGPWNLRAERRVIARRLRKEGCTYQQIGDLFGVSREMVRQDCLPDDPDGPAPSGRMGTRGSRSAPRPRVHRPKGRPRKQFTEGPLAGLDTVTFTEW